MHTISGQTLPLDYQTPQSPRTLDNSKLVRLVALLAAVGLLVLIAHFLQRSRETLGGISDWVLPISPALAGSVYCILISLNVAGRTKPGSVSWLRRIGGIGAPFFLTCSACGWVQDILVDPYARKHDVVFWMVAALATGIVAWFIACLGVLHWNDTNEFPRSRTVAG